MGTNWSDSDGPGFSSSEEEHVVADDEDLVESSDDLPEDLIGADIDSVRDDEDLVKSSDDLMAKGSMESIDSGVSLKSDRSRNNLIHFKDRVSLSGPGFSSSEEEHVVADDEDLVESSDDLPEDLIGADIDSVRDDEDLVKSSDDLSPDFSSSEELAVADDEGLVKSSDDLEDSKESGVSSTSDWPRFCKYFKNKLSFIVRLMGSLYFGINYLSVKLDNSQGCTAHVKETPPSPKEKMATGSMESIDSGVSFKSDRSKRRLINFKDSSSPSSPDFSSSEEELDVADDEDLVKSSDDLEEMNQELSSEVGWEHC